MKNVFKVALVVVAFVTLSFISFEKEIITVVIDAGHGGHDLGGQHDELFEKDLVNAISKKIESLNSDKKIKLLFTRDDDKFVELADRTDFINSIKPDLILSLHVNANKNETTSGFEVFVSDKSLAYMKSNELAHKLVLDFEKNTPLNNRGVKNASFFILSKSEVPALTLEMGFISNQNDRNYISSEEGQNQIAKTILNFVSDLK
jgi:N-acetylmuramoyl-L-alanine amidase